MVRVWYMDESKDDQRLMHMTDPPRFVELESLYEKTGVLYWKIDMDKYPNDALLQKIRKERGYTYEDEITINEQMENYEKKIKIFFEEHLHNDEEIRLCLDGSGYFDVRDKDDQWLRIEMERGDLIVLPAGIYHRFTLDAKNFIKAKRFFVGDPVWTPICRPADNLLSRKEYLRQMGLVN